MVEWNQEKVLRMIKQFLKDRMLVVCELLKTDMQAKASGRQGPGLHAYDKGNFVGSFVHKIIENDNEIIGLVGNTAEYAPYIEFGTGELAESGDGRKGGWYYKDTDGNWHFTLGMRPRPIMRSALVDKKQEIKKLLVKK